MVKDRWIQTKDLILAKYARIERIPIQSLMIHKESSYILVPMLEPCEHDVDIERYATFDSGNRADLPMSRSEVADVVDDLVMQDHYRHVGHQKD
jgi:hypothetical protein